MNLKETSTELIGFLTQPYEAHLQERELQLIEDNMALGGSPYGYIFAGEVYTCWVLKGAAFKSVENIHPDLYEDANALHEDSKAFQKDIKLLTQGLGILLAPCSSFQDVRDALPDMAKGALPYTSNLSRHRPEAWTLAEHPLRQHSNERTKDLITMFLSHRMLL